MVKIYWTYIIICQLIFSRKHNHFERRYRVKKIDLNCDMGESFGAYKLGMDEEVIQHISSANIACALHAGDPSVMDRTVAMAVEHGVGVGAHPGYPDLLGFGRRDMDCTMEDLRNYVIFQIGALEEVARSVAEAIVSANPELLYVALAGAKGELMRRIGEEVGLQVVYEAFPDRAYTPEGTLLSRRQPGAVIRDPQEVSERALRMVKEGVVIAVDGTTIALEAQTLCVHGDTPTAVDLVRSIRQAMEADGVVLTPMGKK
jgi:UPF0271 protein